VPVLAVHRLVQVPAVLHLVLPARQPLVLPALVQAVVRLWIIQSQVIVQAVVRLWIIQSQVIVVGPNQVIVLVQVRLWIIRTQAIRHQVNPTSCISGRRGYSGYNKCANGSDIARIRVQALLNPLKCLNIANNV